MMVSTPDYHSTEVTEVEVEGDEVTELTIGLSPRYKDEIVYNTGEAENAVALNEVGDGMAVHLTLTITDEHGGTDTVSQRVHVRPAAATPGPSELGLLGP
ncbi:hypothetical protein [Salicibibacter kimchii]|uniref:Uncharacterized protein n=1 Tax=Salicibibacter kimchii TaxID=2099786 RepID=A0A345BWB7_9BACI|nr:hypothetical protein [Salicibibacter kimchii]AXF55248.1 hypothetical protein DT065_03920 [Salicibibacter kimchii]